MHLGHDVCVRHGKLEECLPAASCTKQIVTQSCLFSKTSSKDSKSLWFHKHCGAAALRFLQTCYIVSVQGAEKKEKSTKVGFLAQTCIIGLRHDIMMQVTFAATDSEPLSKESVEQLKHVLFACNASLATFTEAWHGVQGSAA